MMRRIRRSLPCLAAVAALLLPAVPLRADEIEPEPSVEEKTPEPEPEAAAKPEAEPEVVAEPEAEPETAQAPEAEKESSKNILKFLDLVLVRPLYFSRLVVGLPFFVFYPFTIASGYQNDVVELLWTDPYEATFVRPLGESPEESY
jgi:hypothetical protein